MYGGSRSLPGRPSLRFLKIEAKRRYAAGEFGSLHDAQAAIAWEHGVPSWAVLKQQICAHQESHALAHVRWLIARFAHADEPGWTAPGEEEFRQHFDARFLALIPVGRLAEQIATMAADLRQELLVTVQSPLQVQFELAGLRYFAAADARPPYRLIGLQGFPLAGRITDPRVKAPPPARTEGVPPDGVAGIARDAFAELGLAALVLAGGQPGGPPWIYTEGLADLDDAGPLDPGHRWPAPGVTALVTGTAVLRLVAEGRIGLDQRANDHLRAVRLADDAVTVRDLLTHQSGIEEPARLFGDQAVELSELMGPVIGSTGPRGTTRPGNAGFAVLGQLIADVNRTPYAPAVTRLVLDPLGMRESGFPARQADIGPHSVSGYAVGADGAFASAPARICTVQALGGLWSAPADLVRLGTGWASLLPADLAREAVTRQAEAGSAGHHIGLGWLISPGGEDALYAGIAADATALLRIRVSDGRTHVVLTNRPVGVESIDRRLLRSWTNPSTRETKEN